MVAILGPAWGSEGLSGKRLLKILLKNRLKLPIPSASELSWWKESKYDFGLGGEIRGTRGGLTF